MKFLANENIPFTTVLYLRAKGYDITSIGIDFPGIQDKMVLALVQEQGRTILTFDRDYGELIFKHQIRPANGVIYFRLDEFGPEEPGKIVEKLMLGSESSFQNTITVINKNGVRQRKY